MATFITLSMGAPDMPLPRAASEVLVSAAAKRLQTASVSLSLRDASMPSGQAVRKTVSGIPRQRYHGLPASVE